MWEYLARNLKAEVNILSAETGTVTKHILYRDLFNQNGMDFVTEISFCNDEKRLVFRG